MFLQKSFCENTERINGLVSGSKWRSRCMDKMASSLDGICHAVTNPKTNKHKTDTNNPFQESTDNKHTENPPLDETVRINQYPRGRQVQSNKEARSRKQCLWAEAGSKLGKQTNALTEGGRQTSGQRQAG